MKYYKFILSHFLLIIFLASHVYAQFPIPRTKATPIIDGQMEAAWDYAARDSIQTNYAGEAPSSSWDDFSIEFRMLWDDNNIYLLAIVTDDIINTSNNQYFYNDIIQIFIDGGNEKNSGAYDNNDIQLSYVYNDEGLTAVYAFNGGSNLTLDDFKNCQFASAETGNGYIYEIALSGIDVVNNLGINMNNGYDFGMDIAITDNDSGERDHLLLWNSPGDVNFWENPSAWGTVRLADTEARMVTIQIPQTQVAPAIDGLMDPIWHFASRTGLNGGDKPILADSDLSAEVRLLWDQDNLYFYVSVNDDVLNTSHQYHWLNDIFTFFIDAGYERLSVYDQEDLQFGYVVNDPGLTSIWNPFYPNLFSVTDFSNCQFASQTTDNGYDYEVLMSGIDLSEQLGFNINTGKVFGLELELGDNDTGIKENSIVWTSPYGSHYWLKPDNWGMAELSYSLAKTDEMPIPKAPVAPVIDGQLDAVWKYASKGIIQEGTLNLSPSDFSGEYQMLWDDTNLYLFVSVKDDNISTNFTDQTYLNDMVQFYFDGNNNKNPEYDENDLQFSYQINSSGLTSTWNVNFNDNFSVDDFSNCQFSSLPTSDGYNYEIALSASDLNTSLGFDLSAGNDFGWDIQLQDNDFEQFERTIFWGAPFGSQIWFEPSLWGTMKVMNNIAKMAEISIPKTDVAPIIDGTMDAIWGDAESNPIDKIEQTITSLDGDTDFGGDFRILWDDNNIYLFVSVTDDNVNTSSENQWMNDGIKINLDGDNEKTELFNDNDVEFIYTVNSPNLVSVWNQNLGDIFTIDDFSNCQFASEQTSSGYNYEIALSGADLSANLDIELTNSSIFGLNVNINDNDYGKLDCVLSWGNPYGSDAWKNPSYWGKATLIDIPAELSAQTDNVTEVTYTTAVLNGTVNSDGLNMNVFFDYGESTTYGNRVAANPAQVSNTENNNVNVLLRDLNVGTTYHYRVVLTNDAYTIYGADITFTTETYPIQINLSHTIDFTRKSKGSDYKPEDYRIVGLPGANDEMIANIFTGKQDEDWQVFWDNGDDTNYLIEYNGDHIFRQLPGRAFWALNRGPLNINQQNKETAGFNNDGEVEIDIHRGWNLVTNPFDFSVEWNEIRQVNQLNNDIPIWYFDGTFKSNNPLMDPFEGYYFDNLDENRTILRIPFKPAPVNMPKLAVENQFDWKVNISITANQYTDDCSYFAVHENASKTRDEFEFRKPRAIGDILSVYFARPDWGVPSGTFNCDVRPTVGDMEEWSFNVQIPNLDKSTLSFNGIDDIPTEFSVFLINNTKGNYYNLREDHSINFTPEIKITSFSVVVGKEALVQDKLYEAIPKEFTLSQNYPNPFNPSTTIPFALPDDSYVTIKVYNILGEEISELVAQHLETGNHHVIWNGRDYNGNQVTSGIYIYQMITDSGKQLNGKMMLLK